MPAKTYFRFDRKHVYQVICSVYVLLVFFCTTAVRIREGL